MKKIKVGILGATGAVGQRFIDLLISHPWFEIEALAASERSIGKKYQEAANWLMASSLPHEIGSKSVISCLSPNLPELLFSALDSTVAGEIEEELVKRGHHIISNAKNFRMHDWVPLLVPEVNYRHLDARARSPYPGSIVTVPNCSTVGLTLALKPLHDAFGIEQLHVVTLQAISGAGYPGVASLDIVDNVIPFISGEEHKLETEPLKILGRYENGAFHPATFRISAQCNRVAVSDGHTECVSIKFRTKPTQEEIISVWEEFRSLPQRLDLPMAPQKPLHYHHSEKFPQPKIHRHQDKGMSVHLGRLRPCPLLDYKFTLLSHNTIRGAAGGGILNAELIVADS